MTIEELTDEEFIEKYGLCKEDAKQIIWKSSFEKELWDYTPR